MSGIHEPPVSAIVPFHRGLPHLARCLPALRIALDTVDVTSELIVVADGATEDCAAVVRAAGGKLVTVDGPAGPAVARNRGARAARGTILLFVDADVVVAPAAVAQILRLLDTRRDAAAVFGAYDEAPDDPGFLSQARNLAHSFIHQRSQADATTFWAGLGAVRRAAFTAVGGFDERFTRPSVEDIDLGYRLRAAGHRIVLDPSIQGTHLKRWSPWAALRTDLRDRGIPWTQLLHRYASFRDDLNVSRAYRLCVVVAYAIVASVAAAPWQPRVLWAAPAGLVLLVALDWRYYAFFARRRGIAFTAGWLAVQVCQHLVNGAAFAIGTALHLVARTTGVRLRGSLPLDPWSLDRHPIDHHSKRPGVVAHAGLPGDEGVAAQREDASS